MNRKNPAPMITVPIAMSISAMDGLDVFVGSGSNLSDVVHSPGLGLGVFLYDVEVAIVFHGNRVPVIIIFLLTDDTEIDWLGCIHFFNSFGWGRYIIGGRRVIIMAIWTSVQYMLRPVARCSRGCSRWP